MDRRAFEHIVAHEWPQAVPEPFERIVRNVAVLVEDEPSPEIRAREGLTEGETLLGYYQGIPHTARGVEYGVGATLPDTITLYQKPIEEEAAHTDGDVARVVRETLWHEVAHHFGFDEDAVRTREEKRDRDGRHA